MFLEPGLVGVLDQGEVCWLAGKVEAFNHGTRMSDNDNLAGRGGLGDEGCQRSDEVVVEAGLGFVEHEQFRRPRGEQRSDPEQVAEGAVGEIPGGERTLQCRRAQVKLDPTVPWLDLKAGSREGSVNRSVERVGVALADRFDHSGQTGAIAG